MKDWVDHPFIFLLIITIGVAGMGAVLAWIFLELGWSGPLSLMKGGIR